MCLLIIPRCRYIIHNDSLRCTSGNWFYFIFLEEYRNRPKEWDGSTIFNILFFNVSNAQAVYNCEQTQLKPVLRNRSIFSDPDLKIRIWETQKRSDPTGSGSKSYLDMFLMFSKINIFYSIFIQSLNILWHLKSKIKNCFDETVF